MASILPNAVTHFDDNNGTPLAGGQVFFYIPNTSTPKNTYQDKDQTILNTNPVILDSRGEAVIWGSGTYRQVVKDSGGNLIWDRITEDPNAGLTGNMTDNVFVAGTDFTPGVTNQLTLTVGPGSIANTWLFFDTAYQTDDQISSINGPLLTLTSPIPVGVQKVTVKIGSTLPIGVPASGTVTDSTVASNAAIQSTKLSFIQAGAGAVTRTVQDKLRDFVSVKDFGAVGDGVTDDTAACTAAIATGKSVFWPEGVYKVAPIAAALPGSEPNRTSAWLLSSGQRMFGVGRNSRLLWGNATTRQCFFKAATCTNIELDSLCFDGGYSSIVVDPTADGSVDGTMVRNCYFSNLLIDVLGGVQFPINAASKYHKNISVIACTTDGPAYHSILFTNCYDAKAVANTFRNVTNGFCIDSSQGSRNVVIADNTADNVLYFCKAESSDTASVNPPQWEAHEISITGNVARAINTYGILINSAADNIVIANNVLTGFSQYGITLNQAAGVSYTGSITVSSNVLQAAVGSVNAVGIYDYITNGSAAHIFANNVITNVLNGFDISRANAGISGGEIVASSSAIVLEAAGFINGVTISGVTMDATTGVNVNGNSQVAKRVTVASCYIKFTAFGVYSQANAQLFNIVGNILQSSAPTGAGVALPNPFNSRVSDNLINMNSAVLNSVATSGATNDCIITGNVTNAPLSIAAPNAATITTGNITSASYIT